MVNWFYGMIAPTTHQDVSLMKKSIFVACGLTFFLSSSAMALTFDDILATVDKTPEMLGESTKDNGPEFVKAVKKNGFVWSVSVDRAYPKDALAGAGLYTTESIYDVSLEGKAAIIRVEGKAARLAMLPGYRPGIDDNPYAEEFDESVGYGTYKDGMMMSWDGHQGCPGVESIRLRDGMVQVTTEKEEVSQASLVCGTEYFLKSMELMKFLSEKRAGMYEFADKKSSSINKKGRNEAPINRLKEDQVF